MKNRKIAVTMWFFIILMLGLLFYGCEKNQIENDQTAQNILYMACVQKEADIQKEIADYNRHNTDCRIQIVSYEEYENPIQQLDIDLMNGDKIDIVQIPNQQTQWMIAQGLLIDLYHYIDEDDEIRRQDFFKNILQAYEVDGQLFQTISWVHLQGWISKRSNLDNMSQDGRDILHMLKETYPQAQIYPDATSNSILRQLLCVYSAEFIDWENRECAFTSERFGEILRLAKTNGKQSVPLDNDDILQAFLENRLLFFRTTLTPSDTILYDNVLAGDYAVSASPFEKTENASIYSDSPQFGIATNSKNKDAAWQFVRRFFLEEYQDISSDILLMKTTMLGIPVRKDCYKKLLKRYTAEQSYEEDGQWYDPYIAGINNGICHFEMSKPMTQEQASAYERLVESANIREETDPQILSIVTEEAEKYFSGEKEIKDVVEIIQKRVTTYLKERG